MRILLLNWRDIRHPSAGGAEVWAHRVAEGLVRRGHSVTLFAASVEGAPAEETIDGVTVVRRGGRLGVYREARRYGVEHAGSYDVVLEEINTRPFFASRWSTVPVVAMIHQVAREVWFHEAPFPIAIVGRFVMEPLWLRKLKVARVLTLSPSSGESLVPYGVVEAHVVLPGSDHASVRYSEKSLEPTVVFLGRLVSSKRPDHAVEAFRRLRSVVPDARMWVMGAGPMEARLAKDLPDGAELLGFVDSAEREDRLARAHVLVTTTVREGWGLNVSEAAALGTPTIGYDSSGLRDSIPMSGGHVVGPDPAELGDALVEFFAGRLHLEPRIGTLSWDEVCSQIEGHLRSVTGSAS